jgi:hypothetical protein
MVSPHVGNTPLTVALRSECPALQDPPVAFPERKPLLCRERDQRLGSLLRGERLPAELTDSGSPGQGKRLADRVRDLLSRLCCKKRQ